jgi:hypothetical protein
MRSTQYILGVSMAKLPKSIIKRYGITKKAWQVFRGKRRGTSRKPKMVRRTRRSYRPWRRRRSRGKRTIPILPIVGLVAATNAYSGWDALKQGRFGDWAEAFTAGMTGYSIKSGDWNAEHLKQGLMPVVAGALGHYAMNFLGVNRYMARLPRPLDKLRL